LPWAASSAGRWRQRAWLAVGDQLGGVGVTPQIYSKPGGYKKRNKNTSIKIKQKFDKVSPVNRSYWTSGLYEELSK